MPLQKVARTPRRPIPGRPSGTPYAFAVKVLDLEPPRPPVTVVRCPWCAEEHSHQLGRTAAWGLIAAHCGGGDYVVVTPAGIPVMAR